MLRQPGELMNSKKLSSVNNLVSSCSLTHEKYQKTILLTRQGVQQIVYNFNSNKYHQTVVNFELPYQVRDKSIVRTTPEVDFKNDPLFLFESEMIFLFSVDGDKQLIPHSANFETLKIWWV
jgi:hypothetical protein